MNGFCEDCNITSYFENSVINYSTNGQQLLFTTDFIYSNPRGTVTSTSLIHHFQSWILSQNTPNLTVARKIVSINKNCPVAINGVTRIACLTASTMVAKTGCYYVVGITFVVGVVTATVTTIIVMLR